MEKMEKYHLSKRDLEVVHLKYTKFMSGPKIALKLGITYDQVKYCLKKPNVKRYINEIVLPEVNRERERLEEQIKSEREAQIEQLYEDLNSTDEKKRTKALKELTKLYSRHNKSSQQSHNESMGVEELARKLDEALRCFGINNTSKDSSDNRKMT